MFSSGNFMDKSCSPKHVITSTNSKKLGKTWIKLYSKLCDKSCFFLTSVIFPKLKMKGGAKNNVFKVFHNIVHKAAYKRAYKSLRW